MIKINNTLHRGTVTVFLFPKGKKYIGVCLELDIVDEDTNIEELKTRIRERVDSYIDYVCDNKKDGALLNRPAPDEYWKKFFTYIRYLQELEKKASFRNHFDQPTEGVIETLPLRRFARA